MASESEARPANSTGGSLTYANVVSAFEEIALTTMAGEMPLDQVLLLIGRRLCELIGVSRCTVYLRRDPENFRCYTGWARGGDITEEVRSLVTGKDRMTAEAVERREPILVKNAQEDPRPNHRAMAYFGVRDLLVVPLVIGDAVIGVTYIDNEDRPHDYTGTDMSTAKAFGILAAIAIRQGELHKELGARTRTIAKQNQSLQWLSKVATDLTEIMLAGGDLQTVLDRVQHLVQLPVNLYASDLTLLAWSLPDRMRKQRTPALPRNALRIPHVKDLVIKGLTQTVKIPPIPALGSHHNRLVTPMTIGKRHHGFLEFVEQGRRFTSLDSKILSQAALAVSLKLLADLQHNENASLARRDFLSDVLHGHREPETLRSRAHLFGVSADGRHVLARVCYGVEATSHTGTTRRDEIEAELHNELGSAFDILGTGVPGADLFLITLPNGEDSAVVERALVEYFPRVQRKGAQYLLICPATDGLAELPELSEEARRFEGAIESIGAHMQPILLRQMPIVSLLAASGGIARAATYAAKLFDPVLAVDTEGTLMATLRSYIDHGGKVRETSKLLGVHENTVRYRLERVCVLSGVDMQDPWDLSRLRFALQMHALCPGTR